MKVYVCMFSWPYEGCSEPLKVYTTKEDAVRYFQTNNDVPVDAEWLYRQTGQGYFRGSSPTREWSYKDSLIVEIEVT